MTSTPNTEQAGERMLTGAEAADKLGVSTGTLSQWRHRGTGPGYYKLGSGVRYKASDLAAWLESTFVPAGGVR